VAYQRRESGQPYGVTEDLYCLTFRRLPPTDQEGNVYTAEVQGKRVQRFLNLSGL